MFLIVYYTYNRKIKIMLYIYDNMILILSHWLIININTIRVILYHWQSL